MNYIVSEAKKAREQVIALKDRFKQSELGKLEMKEFFSLVWLNLKVTINSFVEYIKVVTRYYGNIAFMKADMSVRLMYLFHNPYRMSKRFLKQQGNKDIYAYGETPLTALETIADVCKIGPEDRIYELGSGRGLVCFWLNAMKGCKVVGIEYNPGFVERAQRIVNKLDIHGITFINRDFSHVDFSDATICYLYGTCLDDHTIKHLVGKFAKLTPGTKIITVSFALSDYDDKRAFELLNKISVPFTWGNAAVYIQAVK